MEPARQEASVKIGGLGWVVEVAEGLAGTWP